METRCTRYAVCAENFEREVRIAHISDLHEQNPEAALAILKAEKPDLILCTGDMLERHREKPGGPTYKEMDAIQERKPFSRLLRKLLRLLQGEKPPRFNGLDFFTRAAAIAPVVYSLGNHEWYLLDTDREVLNKAGVIVLDNRMTSLQIRGETLHIGGLSTRADEKFLASFSQEPGYKILLAHHPEYYLRHIQGSDLDVFDLVLSGHAHGGQWRFFNQGVYAPGQGFFPRYTSGMRPAGRGSWIISTGLANTAGFPRFNNPEEVVIIDMHPQP